MPAKRIAGLAECRPAAPTGTYKPKDAIAPSLLRDSAASGRRGISYGVKRCRNADTKRPRIYRGLFAAD